MKLCKYNKDVDPSKLKRQEKIKMSKAEMTKLSVIIRVRNPPRLIKIFVKKVLWNFCLKMCI